MGFNSVFKGLMMDSQRQKQKEQPEERADFPGVTECVARRNTCVTLSS